MLSEGEILAAFNYFLNAVRPAVQLVIGVLIAASVVVWVIKRLS